MAAPHASVPDLARLNIRLSLEYAETVKTACEEAGIERADLIGCHGQTIFHQGEPATYAGEKLATTWQLGDGSRIAQLTKTPTVSDFRQADMAVGGRGAPLVPFFDFLAFRHRKLQRVALNIGGIANITVLRPNCRAEDVIAFDTGPGNMMLDAAVELFTNGRRSRDENGAMAAKGRVQEELLQQWLKHRYFKQPAPKSAGREEFGADVTRAWLKDAARFRQQDLLATLTAFTATTIAFSVDRFAPRLEGRTQGEVIASGGGTRNPTLMHALALRVSKLGYALTTTDALGLPSQAKEAVAFAVLAYETWHKRPANLPSATGAQRAVVLGKVSHV